MTWLHKQGLYDALDPGDTDHPMIVNCQHKQLSTDSTMLPSTEMSGGLGPEPIFRSFVLGYEMLRPSYETDSS